MLADILKEYGGHGVGPLLGLVVGATITFCIGHLRRRRERLRIQAGDARDTVVIDYHMIETREIVDPKTGIAQIVPEAMRIRTLGQAELKRVIPNGHLARILLHRAHCVNSTDTLISMEGIEGSYLLETLTGFVCDRVVNGPFEHDLFVIAPCCEPKELARHQPIVINVISKADLALFGQWTDIKSIRVEHSSDGARLLTLMQMAQRFEQEQAKIERLRLEGKRVTYIETMYMLDLALDRRSCDIPTKPVPWGRFEGVLKEMNLE